MNHEDLALKIIEMVENQSLRCHQCECEIVDVRLVTMPSQNQSDACFICSNGHELMLR